eukprot:CAMPEP_0119314936 /NCGR_PEP_ID=MMETSP1333-20130426/34111_1 /TAXON_ID=418940 /ORGANISM="Scyphosphaera apsteinii, Strain RCC1455" /LENGTH=1402 /DNA_ID=CAMNT_0007320141 /DNA_START=74 /DNA_END=4282 /DNA_ORIENTATION=-
MRANNAEEIPPASDREAQEAAATKLQAAARGHLARKEVKKRRAWMGEMKQKCLDAVDDVKEAVEDAVSPEDEKEQVAEMLGVESVEDIQHVSKEKMIQHLEMQVTKVNLFRKAMKVAFAAFLVVVVVLVIVVVTAWGFKSTNTKRIVYSSGDDDRKEIRDLPLAEGINLVNYHGDDLNVATGSIKRSFTVLANRQTYANIQKKQLLMHRPSAVLIQLIDDTTFQFQPTTISRFTETATLKNSEIGITLKLRLNALPIVEYSNDQFNEKIVPIGPVQAMAVVPQLAAVRHIVFFRDETSSLATVVGEPVTDDEISQESTSPLSKDASARDTCRTFNRNVKEGVVPLIELRPADKVSTIGQLLSGNPSNWHIIGLPETDLQTVDQLCKKVEQLGGKCLVTNDANSTYTNTTVIPIHMDKTSVNQLREHIRETGNPYNVTAIAKSVGLALDGFHPDFHMRMQSSQQHYVAAARRALLATPEGVAFMRRRLSEVHRRLEASLAEEEAEIEWAENEGERRELGMRQDPFGNKDNAYKEHITCYSETEPHKFSGDIATTRTTGLACLTWELAFALKNCGSGTMDDKMDCFCQKEFGSQRSTRDGVQEPELDSAAGRAFCSWTYLDGKPFCVEMGSQSAKPIAVPSCASVDAEHLFSTIDNGKKTPVDPNWPWHLDRLKAGYTSVKYPKDPDKLKALFNGEGVHVFVIDSGIQVNHQEFGCDKGPKNENCRVGFGYNGFTKKECTPTKNKASMNDCMDEFGHGTHVAGIVAGNTVGVAPGVILHPVKMFEGASTSYDVMLGGVEWTIRKAKKMMESGTPVSVQCSFGVVQNEAIDNLFKKVVQNGIPLVVSAGNMGTDSCGRSPAGLSDKNQVITVGAATAVDTLGRFSGWGTCVTVFAPGVNIWSTWVGSKEAYKTDTGTSMAAPMITGLLAVWFQAAGGNVKNARQARWLVKQGSRAAMEDLNVEKLLGNERANAVKSSKLGDSISLVEAEENSDLQQRLQASTQKIGTYRLPGHDITCNTQLQECNIEGRLRQRQLQQQEGIERALAQQRAKLMLRSSGGIHKRMMLHQTGGCTFRERRALAECPALGSLVCGFPSSVRSPDGSLVNRPFVVIEHKCAAECDCGDDESDVQYTYESCVRGVSQNHFDYIYTNKSCTQVYAINEHEASSKWSGLSLTWQPLDAELGEPDFRLDEQVVKRYMDTTIDGSHTLMGMHLTNSKPMVLFLGDDSSIKVSLPSETTFPFYGEAYKTVILHANGYICFDEKALTNAVNAPTAINHFSPQKGKCFSPLFADFTNSRVILTHVFHESKAEDPVLKSHPVPWATFISYENVKVDCEEDRETSTFQARLDYTSGEITVTYDTLARVLDAYIGPSGGAGVPPGFAPGNVSRKLDGYLFQDDATETSLL